MTERVVLISLRSGNYIYLILALILHLILNTLFLFRENNITLHHSMLLFLQENNLGNLELCFCKLIVLNIIDWQLNFRARMIVDWQSRLVLLEILKLFLLFSLLWKMFLHL